MRSVVELISVQLRIFSMLELLKGSDDIVEILSVTRLQEGQVLVFKGTPHIEAKF